MVNETDDVNVLCSIDSGGLMCFSFDQFDMLCSDYEVRVYCQPKGIDCSPTAQPGLLPGQSPTAKPGLDSGNTPTAQPGLLPGQSPTAQPGLLPGQSPTAQPGTTTTAVPTPNTKIPVACQEKMGMEGGHIQNDMISVSSSRDGNLNPQNARLNGPGAWIAQTNDINQYIQVNFLAPRILTGIITQGRNGIPAFVTSYKVYYSTDAFHWTPYQELGTDKVFTGNSNSDGHVMNWFEHPIRGQYLRVQPQTWQNGIAMRMEVLGCYEAYPTNMPPTIAPTSTNKPPPIDNGCIIWDQWVNEGHIGLTSGGDNEPISTIREHSHVCRNPVKIECARASDELAYDQTGQVLKCNLWDGLECFNADNKPLCYDYKVRLGCLKSTPECNNQQILTTKKVSSVYSTVTPTVSIIPGTLPCFEGMDMSACPQEGCANGLYCDGMKCVRKNECTCMVDGKVIGPNYFIENQKCETCQCIAGEVMCRAKNCPDCLTGYSQTLNMTTCQCGCETCEVGEFRCGNGQCIKQSLRCDGVIDCITDEIGCVSTPIFTPPTAQPTPGRTPEVCTSRWSQWYNRDSPDSGDGDHESLTPAELSAFCANGKISRVECLTTDDIPSYSAGDIMDCSIERGAVCLSMDNDPIPCNDYKIRYFCKCEATPTLHPQVGGSVTPSIMPPTGPQQTPFGDSGTTSTTKITTVVVQASTAAPVVCKSRFSQWINTDSPMTGDGDLESWSNAQKQAFCGDGKISSIECKTTDGIEHYSTGEINQCTIEGGAVCINMDNDPIPCSDYQIRYFCECAPVPTPQTTRVPDVTTTPGRVPSSQTTTMKAPPTISQGQKNTPPPLCIGSRWSTWFNRDKPETGDGDFESLTPAEMSIFCMGGRISAIECSTVDNIPDYSSGEITSCTVNNGFECFNANNMPIPCSDYKVRYHCECGATAAPQANILTGVAVCVPSLCPQLNRPVTKQGEILMIVPDGQGCCDKYEVVCKPDQCTPSTLQCAPPMQFEAASQNDCCPTYRCMCPPTCPQKKKPTCINGVAVEVTAMCNCTDYACMPTPRKPVGPAPLVCTYIDTMAPANSTGVVHHIGDTWSDGMCRRCQCVDRNDAAETMCHEESCAPCGAGHTRGESKTQCCGECKAIGCIVNGTLYKAGESIVTKKQCYTKQCSFDTSLETFIISETQVQCPIMASLPKCRQNETEYDSTGCCLRCIPGLNPNTTSSQTCATCSPRLIFGQPADSIGYFKVMDNMELCKNLAPIQDLRECSGYCNSRSSYSQIMRGFANSCNCCQSMSTESRTISLTCTSGRTITKSYSVPKDCGCSACSGGN